LFLKLLKRLRNAFELRLNFEWRIMNSKEFIHHDGDGQAWGVVSTEQLWGDVYALKYNRPEKRLDFGIWLDLFRQAKAAAIEFGAGTLEARLRTEYEIDMFRRLLSQLGLRKKSERIEFQCDLSQLPDDAGSPMRWQTAAELKWDKEQIVRFTQQIIKGALDIDPDENPEDFAQDWLQHHEFTFGPHCIAIGFLDDVACSLVVAQINSQTGWSRLSYMGLIPTYRGRGLGKWVHRHGFRMMKEQGGLLYHGGTHGQNWAMRRLFVSHGCQVYSEMEEWSCKLKGGQ
jgi:GNAT superfamily N-acetyltransferase